MATELLLGELDWTPGDEILAAPANDPAAFAAAIVTMYRDETLWRTVREGALRRLARDNGQDDFARAVAAVLGSIAGHSFQETFGPPS